MPPSGIDQARPPTDYHETAPSAAGFGYQCCCSGVIKPRSKLGDFETTLSTAGGCDTYVVLQPAVVVDHYHDVLQAPKAFRGTATLEP